VAYKPATKSAHFAIGGVHRAIVELGYVIDLAFHVGERDRVIGGIALLNQPVNLLPGDAGLSAPPHDVMVSMMKAR
jgi:hypothetical protein